MALGFKDGRIVAARTVKGDGLLQPINNRDLVGGPATFRKDEVQFQGLAGTQGWSLDTNITELISKQGCRIVYY